MHSVDLNVKRLIQVKQLLYTISELFCPFKVHFRGKRDKTFYGDGLTASIVKVKGPFNMVHKRFFVHYHILFRFTGNLSKMILVGILFGFLAIFLYEHYTRGSMLRYWYCRVGSMKGGRTLSFVFTTFDRQVHLIHSFRVQHCMICTIKKYWIHDFRRPLGTLNFGILT